MIPAALISIAAFLAVFFAVYFGLCWLEDNVLPAMRDRRNKAILATISNRDEKGRFRKKSDVIHAALARLPAKPVRAEMRGKR